MVAKKKSKKRRYLQLGDGAKMLKVRGSFMRWLKLEAIRRGKFLYQVIEDVVSVGCEGKRPWQRGER